MPTQSAITGIIANALGIDRSDTRRLARLQERLRFSSRADLRHQVSTDFQTAQLNKADKWWSRRTATVGRDGATYDSPHIRRRDYWMDCRFVVACTLDPEGESPSLDDVAQALIRPARPLFFGRKNCLPMRPLYGDLTEATSLLDAMRDVPWTQAVAMRSTPERLFVQLPVDEYTGSALELVHYSDRRDWEAGPHTGRWPVLEGFLPIADCAKVS